MRALLPALLIAAATAACASRPPAGTLRFHNQAPVWRVADRTPLAARPAERPYYRALYHTDGFVVRKLTRAMDVRDPERAADVNSLDEVPDSSWFTNRIGVRDLPLDELRRAANVDPSPFDHLPWTITGAKSGGLSIGFVFTDARGDRHLLKFDSRDVPEMETGAHAIGHRILWAAGYHVPQDHIGYIRRADLQISPKATVKDAFGNRSPLTVEQLERALARVYRAGDGRYRVLASRFLPGKPIGPYAREGVRADDPNDTIPHERRRSIRGQVALFAWLNHTDMQEDNTLDVFDPRGHVEHYLIDFGKALGVMGYTNHWKTVGYTYRLDVGYALRGLLSLGLLERPWDGVESPPLRGVGLYEAAHFDPGAWRTNAPYWPYDDADRVDGFWGAKLAIRFTREQLAAVVGEAQYSDPRAAAYMLDTLIARQRKVARYWFGRVSPLDQFTVTGTPEGARLCFVDLALAHDLERTATHYTVDAYGADGRATAPPRRVAASGAGNGAACADVALGPARDAYTIVRLAAHRNAHALPPVRVHVARDRAGRLAVIGLRRE